MPRFATICLAAVLALAAASGHAEPPPAMIDTALLPALLDDPEIVVIDTRGDRPAFEKQRLRGARWLDWDRWDRKLDSDTGVVDAEWRALLADLGIEKHSKILLYDDGRMGWSAMIWLALRRLGITDVQVLPVRSSLFFGQLPATAFESGPPRPVASKPADWRIDPVANPRIVDAAEIDTLIRSPNPLLFDNRSRAEYDGTPGTDNSGLRPGHIPRALLLPRGAMFGADGVPINSAAATALLKSFGVDPDSSVTLYCLSGGRSSAVALILWQAGFTNIAVYPGSWQEWGADPARPAETR